MAEPENAALIEAALRIVHHWARSRPCRVIIEPRALDTAEAIGFDPEDIYAVLLATHPACVHDVDPDHKYPERTVLKMRVWAGERWLYVKVSLCVEIDHNVKVLSFKGWTP